MYDEPRLEDCALTTADKQFFTGNITEEPSEIVTIERQAR
jgi:hypothetical protein